MRVFLQTERLTLRQFASSDVDNLVSLDADPEVMRFITGGRPTPREEVVGEIIPAFLDYYRRYEGFGFWAAQPRSTGEFLGWFHLRPGKNNPPGEVELGYRLHKSAWGHGYATEGSRALIDKAFTDLGVRRVYAETMVVNTASRRVMEKSGLRYVRTFHQDWPQPIPGDEHGDVEYALTLTQWRDRQPAGSRPD
jgi:RimJ/RimL family protein N-acetyltransferase